MPDKDIICKYCEKLPNHKKVATQWHHVEGRENNPNFVIPLCAAHHKAITKINSTAAQIMRRKLTPIERRVICFCWIHRLMNCNSYPTPGFNKYWLSWQQPQNIQGSESLNAS